MRPYAAFDVDGTIFKSSLAEKVVEVGISEGLFQEYAFTAAMESRKAWQLHNSEGTYTAYLHKLVDSFVSQMEGVSTDAYQRVVDRVIDDQEVRRFAFPRVLAHHLSKSHYCLAISGSPKELVRPFVRKMGFEGVYGSTYEVKDGIYTGVATAVPGKAEVLSKMLKQQLVIQAGSVAIGDTFNDAGMLQIASTPIMFNPSKTLAEYGKEFRWPKVLESKDNITVLAWNEEISKYVETDITAFLDRISPVQGEVAL